MEHLFSKRDLRHLLENHKNNLQAEIENLDQNYFLKANEDELKQYFIDKFNIEPPHLLHESIYVDEPSEVDINLAKVVIHVPFEGEAELFKWVPSTFSHSLPCAHIGHHELQLIYEISNNNSNELQRNYKREIDEIDEYLKTVRDDVEKWMRELPGIITTFMSSRKSRLQKNMGIVGSLGLPVRRTGDQTVSVSLPKKRRPSPAPIPKVSPGPYEQEPAIDLAEYDYILNIISSLTIAIERSPSAFSHMGEEQIRDHILIQLNGHYEGLATGETFNSKGKTDILVRVSDKNIFIGECKFWKGQKALLETIDQLFGYTCWSDTKAAVIIFNRNREHTKVLEAIRTNIPQHIRFKRELDHKGENHFRYLFKHPEDPVRNIYVAVIAINLPAED